MARGRDAKIVSGINQCREHCMAVHAGLPFEVFSATASQEDMAWRFLWGLEYSNAQLGDCVIS